MTAGQVDLDRDEVRLGERVWPIALDCRSNTVTVALSAGRFELRPIRWGEKRNLARFARAGEPFLARHFVQLCLNGDQPLPEDPAEREALWTLARWITTPDETASPLPLDPALLLRASVDVSGRLGCAPAELDPFPAADVEMLWSPAGQTQPAGQPPTLQAPAARNVPPVPEGMNRILIVPDRQSRPDAPVSEPDPPGTSTANTDAGESAGGTTAPAERMAPESDDQPPRALPPAGPAAAMPLVSAARAASTGSAPAGPEPSIPARPTPGGPAPRGRQNATRRTFGRIRVTMGHASHGVEPRPDIPTTASDAPTVSARAAHGVLSESPAEALKRPAASVSISDHGPRDHGRMIESPAPAVASPSLTTFSATASGASAIFPLAASGTGTAPEPAASHPAPPPDPLDAWVEQIELAAEELGIEMEA